MIAFDFAPHAFVSTTWCTSVVCGGPDLFAKFSAVSLASRVTDEASADSAAKSKESITSSGFIR
jgi:hypothetical protein